MCPFQCDTCHFWNIQHRAPEPSKYKDQRLLLCIRRANLDAFWGRKSSTVIANNREVQKLIWKMNSLGIDERSVLPRLGPWKVEDECGMAIAAASLLRSLDPGQNDPTVQFNKSESFDQPSSMYGMLDTKQPTLVCSAAEVIVTNFSSPKIPQARDGMVAFNWAYISKWGTIPNRT